MNQRKQNISRWYLLGLAMILMAGCLIASTGIAYARYRTDGERKIMFVSREPVQVFVGVMSEDVTTQEVLFDSATTPQWVPRTILEEESAQSRTVYDLHFAVANHQDLTGYEKEDLTVRVRLVGSLGTWNGAGTVVLTDGTILPDGMPRQVAATVTAIPQDTKLYHDFGPGWIFSFLDEYGKELTWELEGGTYSWQELTVTVDAAMLGEANLLQIQTIGEHAE